MKIFLLGATLCLGALPSCDRGTTVSRADAELSSKLTLTASRIGISTLEDGKIDIEDFRITLTNNTADTIFLSCLAPQHLSDYLKERNPKAICYGISPESGSFHLGSRGLSGSGTGISVAPDQSVSFVAPIPIFADDPNGGKFKVSIVAYLDEGYHDGRILYTDILPHNL